MAIKSDREYRNFANFGAIETRAQGDGEADMIVEGYASTFEEYELFRFDNYIYRERIIPTAFDEADMSDVVFLRDHTGQVYARTKNGLIDISIDEKGLFTKTDLSKTAAAREMYEDIKAENYTQMSFAFTVEKDHFEDPIDDGEHITLTRVIDRINKVYDISAVAFPANPTTDIGISARSLFDGEIERIQAERLEAQRAKNEEARQKAELKLKLMEVIES